MFDLEQSLVAWKHSLLQSSSMVDEDLDELESHLRESISGLGRLGLNDEEAFYVATKRLGQVPQLATEYEKNNLVGLRPEPLVWMLTGYLTITLAGMGASALASGVSAGMTYAGTRGTTTGIIATLVQLAFCIALLALAIRRKEVALTIGRFPGLWLIAMFVALVTLPIVRILAQVVQNRVMDPARLGETYYWLGLGNMVVQLLIYAICFITLYKLRRSHRPQGLSERPA